MRCAITAAACLLLAACAETPSPEIPIDATFSAAEIAWSRTTGANEVNGSAVLRTVGGDAKTCAGLQVRLVPEGAYSRARMEAVFGDTEAGFHALLSDMHFAPAPDGYAASAREEICDAQGNFAFSGVPDGSYFVVTQVVWSNGLSRQGGDVMRRVRVAGGRTAHVVLTGD